MPGIQRKTTNRPTRAGDKQTGKKKWADRETGMESRSGSPFAAVSFVSFLPSLSLSLARSLVCLLLYPLSFAFRLPLPSPSLFVHPIAEIAHQRKQLMSCKHSLVTQRWGLFLTPPLLLVSFTPFFSFLLDVHVICGVHPVSRHSLISTPVSRFPFQLSLFLFFCNVVTNEILSPWHLRGGKNWDVREKVWLAS